MSGERSLPVLDAAHIRGFARGGTHEVSNGLLLRTDIHRDSEFYNLEAWKKGGTSLQEIELREVGSVQGKSLLHLQCHFGQDTLSWARLGAEVTGCDLSDKAIDLARSLAAELKLPAKFVCWKESSGMYQDPGAGPFFFEIIQRKGDEGFGAGNFRALFESIERAQQAPAR